MPGSLAVWLAQLSLARLLIASLSSPLTAQQQAPADRRLGRLNAVPAVIANLPVGHGETFSEPMGGAVAHVAVDWIEWQLKGDKVAARTFVGEWPPVRRHRWPLDRKGL